MYLRRLCCLFCLAAVTFSLAAEGSYADSGRWSKNEYYLLTQAGLSHASKVNPSGHVIRVTDKAKSAARLGVGFHVPYEGSIRLGMEGSVGRYHRFELYRAVEDIHTLWFNGVDLNFFAQQTWSKPHVVRLHVGYAYFMAQMDNYINSSPYATRYKWVPKVAFSNIIKVHERVRFRVDLSQVFGKKLDYWQIRTSGSQPGYRAKQIPSMTTLLFGFEFLQK